MNSSYSFLGVVLSHWAHFAMHRFICVYLCVFCVLCFILHSCCIIVSMVGWTWWDWSLIRSTYLPSVLWHYWLGHLARKNLSPVCLVGHWTLLNQPVCEAAILWQDRHVHIVTMMIIIVVDVINIINIIAIMTLCRNTWYSDSQVTHSVSPLTVLTLLGIQKFTGELPTLFIAILV